MKKHIIIAGAILVVGLTVAGLLVFKDRIFKKSSVSQTVEEMKKEVDLWEDQAGFSFQYPKGIVIDKHDEDTENYAHLELTEASHKGRLIVWAKDTLYGDVDTWVKKDASLKEASVIDTTLGGKPAKKIILTSATKKLITGVIDDQILFTIEAETEGNVFWQETYDIIVQSFVFTPIVGQKSSDNEPTIENSGSVIDEEEVLE
ncbi:MAG: PsbP-related protein [Candidatus Gottesmanbacteria bacterium]